MAPPLRFFFQAIAMSFSALLFFALTKYGLDYCLGADDFRVLSFVYSARGFELEDLQFYLARIPAGSLILYSLFQTGLSGDQNQGFYYAFFLLHAFNLYALIHLLVPQDLLQKSWKQNPYFIAACIITFTILPHHYEVLHWAICHPYVVGQSFAVLGLYLLLRFGRKITGAFFLLLSFATGEFFIPQTLAVIILFSTNSRSFRFYLKQTFIYWASSFLSFLALRFVLAYWYGSSPSKVSLHFMNILKQITAAFEQTFFLHFHKIYYPASLGFVLAIFLVMVSYFRFHRFQWRKLFFYLFCLGLANGLFFIMEYNAPRVLYAFHMLLSALSMQFFLTVQQKSPKTLKISLLLMLLSFMVHTRMIFQIKDHNAQQLIQTGSQLSQLIDGCSDPCLIPLENLDQGLKRDWTLHPDYWVDFATYIAHKYHPNKEVAFKTK